jgi:hypothetical protein
MHICLSGEKARSNNDNNWHVKYIERNILKVTGNYKYIQYTQFSNNIMAIQKIKTI